MHAQAATPPAVAPAQIPGAQREGADDRTCEQSTAAPQLNPGRAQVLGELALIHLTAGQHVQCIEAARGALAADPSHDESAYALATALAATGALDEALALHTSLAHGDRAERFARQRPQLAARSRDEAHRLAALAPKAAASSAAPSSAPSSTPTTAAPPARSRTAGAISRFIWEDFDPYTGLPARPTPGGLKGWYSDHPVFERLIQERRPRRIAEIGSLGGASAVHMARLLDKHGVDGEIVCVDTFLGSRETYFEHNKSRQAMLRRGQYHFFDQFLGNVVAAGQSHRITPFVQTSTNAARILREHGAQFDLVYLDASHEYIDVMSDLREWWPLVAEGGVLLGDDFEDPWYGIIRAGMEFADEIGRPIALHKAFASSPAGGRENTKFFFVR